MTFMITEQITNASVFTEQIKIVSKTIFEFFDFTQQVLTNDFFLRASS